MEGKLIIKYGDPPGEIGEIIVTTVNGCFRRDDPNYEEFYGGCIPPDVNCEQD